MWHSPIIQKTLFFVFSFYIILIRKEYLLWQRKITMVIMYLHIMYSNSDSQVTIYTATGQTILCDYSIDGSILTITSENRGEKMFRKTSNSVNVPNHSDISGARPDSQVILGRWKTIDGEFEYIFFDD